PAPFERVSPADGERMAFQILPKDRADEFVETSEADFALSLSGLGRFRVNVFRQRGSVGLVFRRVLPGMPSFETLGLPSVVRRLAEEPRGMGLGTGPPGSGKATTNAVETVNRIVDFFPPHQQKQVRLSLASSLRGVISQRLLERADQKGRVPSIEVLVNTGRVFDRIVDPNQGGESIEEIIADGEYYGMQTFDQSVFNLYKNGMVDLRSAMAAASNPYDLRISLQQSGLLGTQ